MAKPDFYSSSDYAGLKTDHGEFYYGYEVVDFNEEGDEEWCFRARIDVVGPEGELKREEIVVRFGKLKAKDPFDCVDCLMVGIGWVLTKYALVLPK